MKPGIYTGLGRGAYEKIEAASYSKLKGYAKSPAHARELMLHPPEQTPAMFRGEVAHAAILEPETFESLYVAAPKIDRRTKEGKAAWIAFEAEHAHAQVVPADLYGLCLGMRDAVWSHPLASEVLGGQGASEVAAVWLDNETDALCKGRMDRIGKMAEWTVIPDLKTTKDARRAPFQASIARFDYHAQAAFYLDGLFALSPLWRRWLWIAVEDAPPHGVVVYEPVGDVIEAGRERYRRWLRMHLECVKNNHWPGYPAELQLCELPFWAQKEADDERAYE